MAFRERSLDELADMVCGNFEAAKSLFRYRSSSYLTKFFRECDTDYYHDGSTRSYWVAERLREILAGPHFAPTHFEHLLNVIDVDLEGLTIRSIQADY